MINLKAEQILEKLMACPENWKKCWRNLENAKTGFYYEDFAYSIDRRLYLGINQLILPAGVYITFANAKKQGYKIKAGSKAYTILTPKTLLLKVDPKHDVYEFLQKIPDTEVRISIDYYKKVKGVWYKAILKGYSAINVFRHTDVEGLVLPKAKKFKEEAKENLDYSFINNYTQTYGIKIYNGGNSCYYNILENSVTVPRIEAFDNKDSFYLSLFHELSHSTAIPLKRDIKDTSQEAYAFEEIVAETSAMLLGQEFNLSEDGNKNTNSLAYLKGWGSKLSADLILKGIKKGFESANFLLTF